MDDNTHLYAHLNVADNLLLDPRVRKIAYEVLIERAQEEMRLLAERLKNA